jgi:hypothetical protein
VANPAADGTNGTATVAKFTARVAGNPYAGAETAHGDIGPFKLDSSNSTIKIMVYKTVISDVSIKLVVPDGGALPELKVANTLINQWEELTFDFSPYVGVAVYGSSDVDQIAVFPDFNVRSGETISYFDNISFGP